MFRIKSGHDCAFDQPSLSDTVLLLSRKDCQVKSDTSTKVSYWFENQRIKKMFNKIENEMQCFFISWTPVVNLQTFVKGAMKFTLQENTHSWSCSLFFKASDSCASDYWCASHALTLSNSRIRSMKFNSMLCKSPQRDSTHSFPALSAKFMLQQIEVKSSWVMQQRDSKIIPANALPVSKIRHVCWTDSRLVCLSPAPTHASVALSTHNQECCAHWAQNGNSHAISKSKEGFL